MDAHLTPASAILTHERIGPPRMIVSLLVFVTIVALALPAAVVLIPFTLITGNVDPLYSTGCWIARFAIRVAGIRLHVEGREHIPPGRACIFMANHLSNLDAPALLANLPGRTSVFLKRPLMKIPILGYAFKLGGFIPVDRDGQAETAQQAVAEAQRALSSGLHITTFVEAMRAFCPSKKGRSISPRTLVRPASRSRFTERRRFFPGEACVSTQAQRTSFFIRQSIRLITRVATSFQTPSAPSLHRRCPRRCSPN